MSPPDQCKEPLGNHNYCGITTVPSSDQPGTTVHVSEVYNACASDRPPKLCHLTRAQTQNPGIPHFRSPHCECKPGVLYTLDPEQSPHPDHIPPPAQTEPLATVCYALSPDRGRAFGQCVPHPSTDSAIIWHVPYLLTQDRATDTSWYAQKQFTGPNCKCNARGT